MFSRLHKDLFLVLDDGWDTPLDNSDKNYYGSLFPDTARFPSTRGLPPEQRLSILSQKIKHTGWKGLGLWICAHQAPVYKIADSVAYWTERLQWMQQAGISYWKVNWGKCKKCCVEKRAQQLEPVQNLLCLYPGAETHHLYHQPHRKLSPYGAQGDQDKRCFHIRRCNRKTNLSCHPAGECQVAGTNGWLDYCPA